MKLFVNLLQPAAGDVGVDFGGADAGVAEQFLDHAQVGTVFQQMGGEAVAQHVWRDVALDAGRRDALLDVEPHRDAGKGGAALGEKDGGG